MSALPIALTMGEPAGIGGEISMKAWAVRTQKAIPPFFLIDDPARLQALSDQTGLGIPVQEISNPGEATSIFPDALPVLAQPLPSISQPGRINSTNAASVISSIDRAVKFVFEGQASAVVTNPIQKSALYEAGFEHPGHTEYLASLCFKETGTLATPVMMLAVDGLRAVPATIHIPLKDVPTAITEDLIVAIASITADALRRDFAMANPRIAIAALNPHAGEAGTIGTEERDIIKPAIDRLKASGLSVSGPHPADALFHAAARFEYDAAIAMYHDQALIPIKTLDFDKGVNITLGLPIIRTSPDHGTALDLAGTGRASASSLIEALYTARFIADIHARESQTV